jgi:hypothetical protein
MSSMVFVAGFVVACAGLVVGAYLFARSDELDARHVSRARTEERGETDAGVKLGPGSPAYSAEPREVARATTGAGAAPRRGR